jgi:hypothetical protein
MAAINQVLVLSQIAKKQTLILVEEDVPTVKMVRHFPSCHIRYLYDFKMAALSSQTIHACFAVAFRTQTPTRFVTGEYFDAMLYLC